MSPITVWHFWRWWFSGFPVWWDMWSFPGGYQFYCFCHVLIVFQERFPNTQRIIQRWRWRMCWRVDGRLKHAWSNTWHVLVVPCFILCFLLVHEILTHPSNLLHLPTKNRIPMMVCGTQLNAISWFSSQLLCAGGCKSGNQKTNSGNNEQWQCALSKMPLRSWIWKTIVSFIGLLFGIVFYSSA